MAVFHGGAGLKVRGNAESCEMLLVDCDYPGHQHHRRHDGINWDGGLVIASEDYRQDIGGGGECEPRLLRYVAEAAGYDWVWIKNQAREFSKIKDFRALVMLVEADWVLIMLIVEIN